MGLAFPGGTSGKTQVGSLGWEDPQEEGTAVHSNILAWKIPWTEEPGGLQSMGSQRVRHDSVTKQQQQQVLTGINFLSVGIFISKMEIITFYS